MDSKKLSYISGLTPNKDAFSLLIVITAVLCALLVCEVPMFSFKGKGQGLAGTKRTAFICISLIAAIVVAVFGLHWALIPMGAVLVYICMNLIFAVLKV